MLPSPFPTWTSRKMKPKRQRRSGLTWPIQSALLSPADFFCLSLKVFGRALGDQAAGLSEGFHGRDCRWIWAASWLSGPGFRALAGRLLPGAGLPCILMCFSRSTLYIRQTGVSLPSRSLWIVWHRVFIVEQIIVSFLWYPEKRKWCFPWHIFMKFVSQTTEVLFTAYRSWKNC